jgi:hypothetical protein
MTTKFDTSTKKLNLTKNPRNNVTNTKKVGASTHSKFVFV